MEITLIYPHQLFAEHPSLAIDRPVFLIEEPLIFGTDAKWPMRLHKQKRIFHRASLKAYAQRLEEQGYDVTYLECGQLEKNRLFELIPSATRSIHLANLCDDLLSRRLAALAKDAGVRLISSPSPMFLTPRDWLAEELSKGKKPFMARFYKSQRIRMGILINDNGEPEGGQWSFDEDNRKKLPKDHEVPENPGCAESSAVKNARKYVDSQFTDSLGSADSFIWPTTHQQASDWLDDFLERRLELFGDYEDALSSKERVIYHSQLTPLLNSGLLTPKELIERTLEIAAKRDIPINSLEGFIRQIIGWREFIFGMYKFHGRTARRSNFWGFDRKMPESFYTGETGIPPLDQVIKRALDHNYAHHIERLMVLGSFMLLCRIDPDDVYKWFMELFIDAYDWVMVPNVYGMSQFADGGVFTTKPYLCGSNYIRKMSDYPKGDWCDTWDGLYWTFIADYKEVFANNHRMSMMARNVQVMDEAKLSKHRENAEFFVNSLNFA